jgi:hypothetical protein
MPARSVNFTLTNSSGSTIAKTFEHHCHGQWTDGLSAPATIPNGATIVFQAESGGILTGAEGYVKYGVPSTDTNGDPTQDELYLYWDNPFLGQTKASGLVSTQSVQPDCDFEKQPPGFPPLPSRFAIFGQRAGGPGAPLQAFWDFASGGIPFAGPLIDVAIIFGNVHNEPEATLILTLAPAPTSVGGFSVAWGFDPRRGLRALTRDAPVISLRNLFGIPP